MHRSFARLLAPLGAAGVLASLGTGAVHAQDFIYEADRNVTVVQADHEVINHYDTVSRTFSCPDGSVLSTFLSDGALYRNQSSDNVNETLWSGGAGGSSFTLTFTNWNLSGDQTTGAAYVCTGNIDPQAQQPAAPDPQAQPQPQPQAQQPQAPVIQVGLNQADFQAAYTALLKTLPPAPRVAHW
jgi:hypothetical protein